MRAKKSLGQNFLKCSWVSDEMIKMSELKTGDTILEIGPGKGALTQKLLAKGARVVAVEKDENLAEFLKDKFSNEISKGQLKLFIKDIKDIKDTELKQMGKYKLVANIPYYITGEIIRSFLEAVSQPESLTILVQKEVADRIVNQKGNILKMSVLYYGKAEKSKKVPASCFTPKPKVDSAILHIKTTDAPSLHRPHREIFFKVIHSGFAHKRKKLKNNLALTFQEQAVANAFSQLGLNNNTRAEELSFNDWCELARLLE